MSGIPRRELEEIVFMYEQEPSLRDIYVEGAYDASILRWFLEEQDLKDVNVYEISDIEINKEFLIDSGKKSNNRERVIYLADYLHNSLQNSDQFICIADRDFNHFIDELFEIPALLFTDFTSMEMYFFGQRILEKFFIIICNKSDLPCRLLLNSFTNILQELFLMRLANEYLQWNMAWLNSVTCIEESNWNFTLNSNDFKNRLLNKNGRMNQMDEFNSVVEKFRESLDEEIRYQMHGHDYINLFVWLLHKKGLNGSRKINEINLPRILASSLTISEFLKFNLFNSIASVFTPIDRITTAEQLH